ncbi:MAG: DUF3179 domain-containing protein [Bacteroidota bacterium]
MLKFNLSFLIVILGLSCNEGEPTLIENPDRWLIPKLELFEGAGKDEIVAIDYPQFETIAQTTYLEEEDLVTVLQVDEAIKAYPHAILDVHEIVNDKVADLPIAINYCPFTGTGMAWERTLDGVETTFGISGLLYNTNLMPFDRSTETIWSQLEFKGVNGALLGQPARVHSMVEMPYGLFKKLFPTGKVLSKNTGFNLVYGDYPYLDFRTNNDFFVFPVTATDTRLPNKERVLCIIGPNATKIYRFSTFNQRADIQVVSDFLAGRRLAIFGSAEKGVMSAVYASLKDGTPVKFLPEIQENGLFKDTNGNEWTILGRAVSGDLAGTQLDVPRSFMGYWFAFAIFYPNLVIYSE